MARHSKPLTPVERTILEVMRKRDPSRRWYITTVKKPAAKEPPERENDRPG